MVLRETGSNRFAISIASAPSYPSAGHPALIFLPLSRGGGLYLVRVTTRQQRPAILVLGMHRSGTSAAAGTLYHLGVAFGSKLLEPAPDNPRGFFEHVDICDVHEELLARFHSASDDPRALAPFEELLTGKR